MANTSLAVIESFEIAPISSADISAAIAEELGGMGDLELSRVKFPSGGGLTFTIKHPGAARPESAEYLDGIILHHHSTSAYWPDPFNGGNLPPECSSMDGLCGFDAQTGAMCICKGCKHNEYGTEILKDGTYGRGKACKNGHRIYLLRDGEYLPIMITLPPTGLKALKSYLQGLLLPRKKSDVPMRSYQVITRIGLTPQTSGGGIEFAAPTFETLGIVPKEHNDALLAYSERFKAAARQIPLDNGGFTVDDSEEVPF